VVFAEACGSLVQKVLPDVPYPAMMPGKFHCRLAAIVRSFDFAGVPT
jgi:hypothetical protein